MLDAVEKSNDTDRCVATTLMSVCDDVFNRSGEPDWILDAIKLLRARRASDPRIAPWAKKHAEWARSWLLGDEFADLAADDGKSAK